MADLYSPHLICPHCGHRQAFPDWPATACDPVLVDCPPSLGGCGGHALIQPPAVQFYPFLRDVTVDALPLSDTLLERLRRRS
jgi:hypothetical protein